MVEKTLEELVQDLRQRRRLGEPPPVLLLGAGASVESGIGAMTDLFELVRCRTFGEFCEYVRPLTAAERYRLLAEFLQTRQPAEVTPGYRALATLCEQAYLDIVLTTNVDPLLDDALASARLWRRDYILLVNGIVKPDRLDGLLGSSRPRVKVLKLHGDLFYRSMAWTPAEMESWIGDIWTPITQAIRGRDVLVVGHSLRDTKIRELVLGGDGVVWYVTPAAAPAGFDGFDRLRLVTGPEAAFERLFSRLLLALHPVPQGSMAAAVTRAGVGTVVERPGRPPTTHVSTVDDLMSAVVRISVPGEERSLSGFLLAKPRVIVTDGWAGNVGDGTAPLEAITTTGRFKTRVRRRHRHPFGPLVLEAPDGLSTPGLSLDRTACPVGLPVRMAVAVGERPGIADGVVLTGREETLRIDPLGEVPGLVRIEGAVAPGASGAPVVDEAMAVRGFVVAGGVEGPPCFMYPSSAWARALQLAEEPAGH